MSPLLEDDATHLLDPSDVDIQASDNLKRLGPKTGISLSLSQAQTILSRVFPQGEISSYKVSTKGYNNRLYYVTASTRDGSKTQYIIKVCGRYWHRVKTETEVVGMRLAMTYANVPTPLILEWDSEGMEFGIEFTIMRRLPGLSLEIVWKDLEKDVKQDLIRQLVLIVKAIKTQVSGFAVQPEKIGNWIAESDRRKGGPRSLTGFEIGPTLEGEGPWTTYKSYVRSGLEKQLAISRKEGAFLTMSPVWARVEKLLQYLDTDDEITNDSNFVFTHGDLDAQNILVKQTDDGSKMLSITAILDWEWSGIFPAEEEYFASFGFAQEDGDDSDFLYDLLHAEGVPTPRTIPHYNQRKCLYDIREHLAPWFLIDHNDPESEEVLEQVQSARVVVEAALRYLGY